ncbi:hypothetical protein HAX54_013392, partial [Datura stramonium]|nr:hypothetical protein [Datura stramonium]
MKDPNELGLRGMGILFTGELLCRHLTSLIVPIGPLIEMCNHPPYRVIHHTLCGVQFMALWLLLDDRVTTTEERALLDELAPIHDDDDDEVPDRDGDTGDTYCARSDEE